MGASGWQYTVPFEEDLQAALDRLCANVFQRGEYLWPWEGEWVEPGERRPRPATMAELLADELIATEGTHSILDCSRVVPDVPSNEAELLNYYGSIIPVSTAELLDAIGTDLPSAQHLDALYQRIPRTRWVGRCAVLYATSSAAEQLAFWGHSDVLLSGVRLPVSVSSM